MGRPSRRGCVELFGTPERWSTTLRTLLWTRTTLVVPPFTDATEVVLPVACSYDLEVNAASYLSALEQGEVPLEFLFSGSRLLLRRERDAADSADLLGAGGRVPAAGRRLA